jgi:hypothetical protein
MASDTSRVSRSTGRARRWPALLLWWRPACSAEAAWNAIDYRTIGLLLGLMIAIGSKSEFASPPALIVVTAPAS